MAPSPRQRRSWVASGSSRRRATSRSSAISPTIRTWRRAASRSARSRTGARKAESRVEPTAPSEVDALVEHLFRHSAGRMVSSLARRLGPARLDLAEEAVQDALVRALHTWPYGGVPVDPRAWLFQVAKHRALDLLRREASLRGKIELLENEPSPALGLDVAEDDAVGDDELAMMFMCCH